MTQRYDTYKDSGVQWLGDIPGHWGCVALSKVSDIILGKMLQSETKKETDILIPYICAKDVHFDGIDMSNLKTMYFSQSEMDMYEVRKGDMLIVEGGAGAGNCSILRNNVKNIGIQNSIMIVRSNADVINSYICYFMSSIVRRGYVNFITNIATIPHFTKEKVSRTYIPLPPLSEQRSIVSFLDAKCGKIDEWVTKKQKEVEHLQELKQRVIADAVTRGLNPHVKMKATNIPWIKEIPGHWECVPLKYFIETKSGTAINVKELDDKGTYPVYGGGSQIGFCNKYNCEESEIIVGRVGAKCGCVTFPNKKVWATDNALIIKTNLYPRFTAFVLVAADLNRLNAATAQPLITGTKIKHVRIALPPLSEQKQIVSYLDTKCSKIEKLIANINKEIERIKEYKQRLISDVVTGQIKVC